MVFCVSITRKISYVDVVGGLRILLHPALLVALLFYSYAAGVSSVRELERAARTGGSERQEGGRATAERNRKQEDRQDPGSPVAQWLEVGIETVPEGA